MRNKIAWGIAIGSSIPQGIVIAWTAMMVINLTQVLLSSSLLFLLSLSLLLSLLLQTMQQCNFYGNVKSQTKTGLFQLYYLDDFDLQNIHV